MKATQTNLGVAADQYSTNTAQAKAALIDLGRITKAMNRPEIPCDYSGVTGIMAGSEGSPFAEQFAKAVEINGHPKSTWKRVLACLMRFFKK